MTAFKYYLGLDMGTNSVGWAATDPEYRLLKAKGKDLWGIREFNEAWKRNLRIMTLKMLKKFSAI